MQKLSKSTIETAKTVIIAVLVSGVVAFIAGMHYQSSINTDKQAAVSQAVKTVSTLKK